MDLRGTQNWCILVIFLSTLTLTSYAEGTKQLSPTSDDVVLLHTNASGFGSFAAYNGDSLSRLNIRIKDFNTEKIYIGLSGEADNNGVLDGSFWFRIKDPAGNVVHGPFLVSLNNDNCETWDLAVAGPDVINPGTGYNTAVPYATFDPTNVGLNGDYYVEFSELANAPQNNIINVKWFDFTVVSNGTTEETGRVWSNRWALRTPRVTGAAPECEWDRPFEGAFYTYTMDGFVSRIDFSNSGFQGLSFTVAFGLNGPGTTGDVLEDRKSTNVGDSTATAADHQVFLNEPDETIFMSTDLVCGDAEVLDIRCEGDNICIEVGVTQPGQVELLLDFFGDNAIFDPGTEDVLIAEFFMEADTMCVLWDKRKGDGSELDFSEPVQAVVRYSQGVQHYAAFDVEFLKTGFCVQTIRPVCQGQSNLLYWDDSNITDFVSTPAIDESDPGTGQPLVQINGCVCNVNLCRTWDNFQTGTNPDDCDGAPAGYGNERTLNTWWFAASVVIGPFEVPVVRAMATGGAELCPGDSTALTVLTNPDSLAYQYTWSGPNGFSANTQDAGFVTDPGDYIINILDPVTGCSDTDTITLEVADAIITSIDFTCTGSNSPDADVDLSVTGGIPPYSYMWSTGDTTEDLTMVPSGTYTVTVTDSLGCSVVDSVTVEGCCTLDVTCPPADGGTFDCVDEVPAANPDLIMLNDFCDPVNIAVNDTDNGGNGCGADPLVITRTYTVTDAEGGSAVCVQTFTVVDDLAPVVSNCPPDVTVSCLGSIDPQDTGQPSYSDNCTSSDLIIVTFVDDSTGFDGSCSGMELGVIQRTFYAEDLCGNVDSSCVQLISISDTEAPTFTVPADVTIDCTVDPATGITGEVTDAMDNCSAISINFTDQVVVGQCPAIDTVYRTWSVTDACGNEATGVQVITRTDTSPPQFTLPPDTSIECLDSSDPSNTGDVTNIVDDCSGGSATFADVIAGQGQCPVVDTIYRTWTVTDGCGNSSTGLQIITRVDMTPPTFTVPADVTIDCEASTDPSNTGDVTDLMDECSMATISFSDTQSAGQCPIVSVITRTWVGTDDCQNTLTAVQIITTIDTIAPVITPGTCPVDITLACDQEPGDLGVPEFTDNCSGATLEVEIDSIGFVPPSSEGQIVRRFIITDGCGNVNSSCVQTIFVVDTIAPGLTCPPDLTLSCTESTDTMDTGVPVISDNCGNPIDFDLSFDDVLTGFNGCGAGTIERTFTITDVAGNATTCLQILTIADDDGPTFTVPGSVTVDCDVDFDDLDLLGDVSNVMDCSSIVDTSYTDIPGMMDCTGMGEIMRVWSVEDACGNVTTGVQSIFVQDTVPPQLTPPADVTISCEQDPQDTSLTGSIVVISDECSMMFMLSYQDDLSGLTGCNGTGVIRRIWNASDECDNMVEMDQLITVVDNTPPVSICQDVTIDFSVGPVVTITPQSVDLGSSDECGSVSLNLSQSVFDCTDFTDEPVQQTILTVTDDCGNASTCEASVTGVGGAGVVLACPDDMFVALESGQCEALIGFVVDAGPLCGTLEVVLERLDTNGFESGDYFPPGVYEFSYLARNIPDPLADPDFIPDTVYCDFTITVVENEQTTNTLTCNNGINISFDATCELFLGPDMMLEGGNYGCFDDFLVEVEGVASGFGGVLLTTDNVILGDTYTVSVTDTKTGISCWGNITVEDKIPPMVTCEDQMVLCSESLDPVFEQPDPSQALPYAPIVVELCDDPIYDWTDQVFESSCGIDSIYRFWEISDQSGNVAECLQVIRVISAMSDDVVIPPNYEGECNGSIDPSVTGYPTLGGIMIQNNAQCNTVADYHDIVFDACGGETKIVRKWTVVLGCTHDVVRGDQVIKLSDNDGPAITCPEDMTFAVDPWDCNADVQLPVPEIIDACGSDFVVTVDAGEFNDQVEGEYPFVVVKEVPFGIWPITWIAEDDCGNISECTFYIQSVDQTPPTVICDSHTKLSLGEDADVNNGLTKLAAITLDDGSFDNCGDVTFTARRMTSCIDFDWTTNGAGIDETPNGIVNANDRGLSYREYVPFACCDVGTGPIMVELRVEDEYGNVSFCMVEVTVEDKISPFITCPPDITVSCDFWFAAEEGNFDNTSDDPMTPIFGDVLDAFSHDESERRDIVIDDPGNDEVTQPFNWGKDGWADDNCAADVSVRVLIAEDCSSDDLGPNAPEGAVRRIERVFTATDAQGLLSNCKQTIWVVDFEPFYISDETCVNADPRDGVIWPCDEEYTFCPEGGIEPTYPEIFDDNCSLVGVTFNDTRFDFVDGACYKILREWTVIDWCQFDAQSGLGRWTYTQVIKVIDNEPTFILGCPIEPVTRSVLDAGVSLPDNNQVFLGEGNPQASSCSVHYTETFRLSEFCSDAVTYDVKIYPFNGPDFIQLHEARTVELDTNGFADAVIDTRNSDILSVRLNGLPYNSNVCSNWPLAGGDKDYHRVLISVEDGCGNVNSCEYLLRLEDKKAPSPVCLNLSTVVMPSNGEVTIWAKDFNASSFDDCTPADSLKFGFGEDNYMPSITINCDSIIENGGNAFEIDVWVADDGNDDNCDGEITWDERNKDFCTVLLLVDDNMGVCPNFSLAGGHITTDDLAQVEDVKVQLVDDSGDMMDEMMTGSDGMYYFLEPQPEYDIVPYKNDDHRNGVSTWDIVRLMKHLMGMQELEVPYQRIAADVNNDQQLSALDIIEIRQLLLGNTEGFTNNTSWRFIDAAFEFIDPYEPWYTKENIELEEGMSLHKDFVGVKIGDLDRSVVANINQGETKSTKGLLTLEFEDQEVSAGEVIEIPVRARDFDGVNGMQFTLDLDGMKLVDILPGELNVGEANIGRHATGIAFSWGEASPVSVDNEAILFTLRAKANKSGSLSTLISLDSDILESEGYLAVTNAPYYPVSVALRSTTVQPENTEEENVSPEEQPEVAFALYQNTPNPFKGDCNIRFDLPSDMEAQLSIYNPQGAMIYQLEIDGVKGVNTVTLSSYNLNTSGVLLYVVQAGPYKATKKMVIIE